MTSQFHQVSGLSADNVSITPDDAEACRRVIEANAVNEDDLLNLLRAFGYEPYAAVSQRDPNQNRKPIVREPVMADG